MKSVIKKINPCEKLSKFIECYWVQEKNAVSEIIRNNSVKVIPTNSIEINFYSGSPICEITNGKLSLLPSSTVTGQKTVYKEYSKIKETDVFIVRFKPWGAFPFFDIPLTKLVDQNINLSETVLKKGSIPISELIYEPGETQAFINKVENFLLFILNDNHVDYLMTDSVLYIHKKNGIVKISEIAEKYNMSRRHFERRFKTAIGINPKSFIQIVKMHYLINLKKTGLSWNEAGVLTNYYDISHINKNLQNITGLSPSQFFNNLDKNEVVKFFNSQEFLPPHYSAIYI